MPTRTSRNSVTFILLWALTLSGMFFASCIQTPLAKSTSAVDSVQAARSDNTDTEQAEATEDEIERMTEDEFRSAIADVMGGEVDEEIRREKIDALIAEFFGEDAQNAPEIVEDAHLEELDEEEIEIAESIEEHITDDCPPMEGSDAIFYDYPVVLNDRVELFLNVYSNRRKGTIQRALNRSGQYLPMMREVFRSYGLPEDLVYLSLIESAYLPKATSHAGAHGLWQFMPFTGKRFNLQQDWWIDERSDPFKSTVAAAQYLTELYSMWGDWHLALASYNAGEGRVGRAIRRHGVKDYWALSRKKALPKETRNYVPAYIAAVIIAKNPEKYGFTMDEVMEPKEYDEVLITQATDLALIARCAGTTVEELERLNPELKRWCTPATIDNYKVNIPMGTAAQFYTAFRSIPKEERVTWVKHKVRRGESLGLIASRYRSSVGAIAAANKLRNPNQLSIGQNLIIPNGPVARVLTVQGGSSNANQSTTTAANATSTRKVSRNTSSGRFHTVRRGESPGHIAQKYGVSTANLLAWNGLNSRSVIHPGDRLIVRGGTPVHASSDKTKVTYRVRSGDSPWKIAQKHRVSVDDVLRWNGLSKNSVLQPGQRMTLYVKAQKPDSSYVASTSGVSGGTTASKVTHRVQNGESLWIIANKYRVSTDDLKRWNNINGTLIKPGMLLTVHLK